MPGLVLFTTSVCGMSEHVNTAKFADDTKLFTIIKAKADLQKELIIPTDSEVPDQIQY